MKTLKRKQIMYVVIAVILLAGVGSLIWASDYFNKGEAGTYQAAEIRCGQKPVIGAGKDEYNDEKIYYAPGPPNKNQTYDLLSLYDPANLDLSEYSNPEFFCSVEEARSAGYVKHGCCGFVPPSRD